MIFGPREWAPIARMLGAYRADVKAKLEAIAAEYARLPDKGEDAARHRKRREVASEIAAATRALLEVLGRHGTDYVIAADSLSAVLEGIAEAEEAEAEEARANAPANREDRRRTWLLDRLITVWRVDLGRAGGTAVDRSSGAVVEEGIVAFLLAASRPILPHNHPLTSEAARHAVRAWRYPEPESPEWTEDDGTDPFLAVIAADGE